MDKSKAKTINKKHTAIDLFSGCGGLSQGLVQAGFKVLAAIELDKKAATTYTLNHPKTKMFNMDIISLPPEEALEKLNISPGELDLLAGCPPCQGFSRLRTKNKGFASEDTRNDLIFYFLEYIKVMKPKNIMLENVPTLIKDHRFHEFCLSLDTLGYSYKFDVLDAKDYSVPQRRKRLILLASISCIPNLAAKSSKFKTVRDAIGKKEIPENDNIHSLTDKGSKKVMEIIKNIPKNGGSRTSLPPHLQLECHRKSNGFYDVYGRMQWDDPSPTITSGCNNPSKGRFIHPEKDRAISLREAALLQGFPISYKFIPEHGKGSISLMIGNALPPPFIKAHALSIIRQIEGSN